MPKVTWQEGVSQGLNAGYLVLISFLHGIPQDCVGWFPSEVMEGLYFPFFKQQISTSAHKPQPVIYSLSSTVNTILLEYLSFPSSLSGCHL